MVLCFRHRDGKSCHVGWKSSSWKRPSALAMKKWRAVSLSHTGSSHKGIFILDMPEFIVALLRFVFVHSLQARSCCCVLKRKVRDCSVGPVGTRRRGIKSSVTTKSLVSFWTRDPRRCRDGWRPWPRCGESTSWSSPHTSSTYRRRSRAAGQNLSQELWVLRKHVTAYLQYFFALFRDPVDPAVAEYDLALTSSTVSELAEARRTTYHSGRWIWDDQNGETSISITGPHVTLPSNGDCSAYYSWVDEKSGNQGPGTQKTAHHPCHFTKYRTGCNEWQQLCFLQLCFFKISMHTFCLLFCLYAYVCFTYF